MRFRAKHTLPAGPSSATDPKSLEEWQRAEQKYRGLLYSALGRMAAAGQVVTLEESRDLIVDFFLEDWEGLRKRYRPELASPATYVYRAFVLYARPKIRQLRKWQNSLVDTAQLADRAARSGTTARGALIDADWAIRRLPDDERAIFVQVLTEKTSLRDLAAQFKITRYRARELLCNAFGRVLVALEARGTLTDEEWEISLALWRDGLRPREVATQLDISTIAVQACRMKVLDLMGPGLRAAHRRTRPATISQGVSHMADALALLIAAIRDNTPRNWKQVERHREDIIQQLHNNDLELSGDLEEILESKPEIHARLLEALGGTDDDLTSDERQAAERLIAARDNDEDLVGATFAQVLTPGLSESLLKLDQFFTYVPRQEHDVVRYLDSRTDVRAARIAGADLDELVSYGVTPMTLLYASLAPHNIYQDQLRDGFLQPAQQVRLTIRDEPSSALFPTVIIREIGMLAECEEELARGLYKLCFAIACDQHPYFWNGFRAEPEGSALLLTPIAEKPIEERWKPRVEARDPVFCGASH